MNSKHILRPYAVLLTITFCFASPATARNAKCLVQYDGTTAFRGSCDFIADPDGTFSIAARKGSKRFMRNIDAVSVYITKPGHAEVRGLTKLGINSRWGPAKRSSKDRACWVGEGFKVCAW